MWYRAKYKFGAEPGKPRSLKLVSTWDSGHEYSVEVDSAAFTDIYGKVSAKYKQGVRIPSMDEYGTLIMTLQNMEGKNCLLQLLNESDKPVKEAYAKNNQATFHYIKPGTTISALSLMITTTENGIRVIMQLNDSPKPFIITRRLSSVRLSVMYRERGIPRLLPTLQAEACSHNKAEG